MKSKIQKIPKIHVNPWLKNGKNRLIKDKITKSCITFRENKPNLVNFEIAISSFETSKYEIFPTWRSEKQTQSKPNTNPIAKRPKMNTTQYKKIIYEIFSRLPGKKANPIKPNWSEAQVLSLSKDNQSSLINNHLKGWANLNHCFPWDSLRRPIDGLENFGYCTKRISNKTVIQFLKRRISR